MNESPKSVKDLILQNEALSEDNDTLYETNEQLILEIRRLKQDLNEVKIHEEMLVKENRFLDKQNRALKLRCSKYSLRISDLEAEIKDMKFTHKMLNSEEAGRTFAQELLGKPTKADLEEETFIAAGEAHYEKNWNITGDDF